LWAAVVLLAGAWAILWSNNLGYLPLVNGFDASNHMQYVDYILKHKALPLANEGFEMYQPPLYYLLAAGQLAVFGFSAMQANGVFLLRIFGMACGIATFVLTFLSLRLVFPKSARQQFFGLLLAALMPATFYLCHYVTNEILATALVAASVYVCLRAVTAPRIALGQYFICGVCLGAALLAKSSAIIAIPPVFVVLAWNLYRKGAPIKSAVGYLATVGIAALVVCGWHYGRVMVHYGNPLVGNWDAIVGFKWWQQQGYHTTSYYLPLGRSFSDPFFSAFTNFWDGIYTTLWGDGLCGGGVETDWRPPWNYDLMAVGYIFALVPTVMILLGAVLALVRFIRNPSPEGFLMLSLPALVGLLLLYYSLKVPSYAAAKAFYGSSALVPLCVFGAAGGEFLVRRARLLGALLCVGLGLWAVNTYASFWIRQQASQTHLMIARGFSYDGRHDLAAAQVLEILKNDPQNSAAAALLIDELDEQDRPDDAKTVIARSESFSKDNPDWHVAVGDVLARAKKFDEAAAEARRALDLAPDHLLASHRWSEWLYDGGHKQEAIDACREALRIFPSNPQLHYRLGSAYWDIGQRRDGVAQFRVAVTLNDQGAEGHDRLGYALLTLQQCDEAVAEFRRACELKPKFAGFSTHLALGLACQGKTADAIETYRQALKLDPKYAPALDGLARILATCPDATLRDGAQAVTLANQACELTERKKALYLETLAAAFAETGKFAEAESTMQQAVESAQASGEKEVLENGPKLTQLFQAKQPWRRDSNPKAPSSNL
jgi:tetratricopeptide (TPR) repeat protein